MALTYNSQQNETIAAIATGISESGIGIIRISGPEAIEVGERIYRNRKGRSGVRGWKANTIHFGYIVDPRLLPEGEAEEDYDNFAQEYASAIVDEVMISLMRSPHSYTTEDTIEINCHGGVYLMNRVLQLVLDNGCRMAEPGEFTKRAFLGGRIDLSRAEAVMDLIRSQNEFSRRTSLAQLSGSVSGKVRELREKILYEIAFIESALDDPENYSLDGYPEQLRVKCDVLVRELNHILDYSKSGRVLKEGIRTVIVGKPNAGKSSLLNYLSGQERAIVTDVAGTTRDTLEESVKLGDVILNLTDTAGIHETQDKVEKIGVERAKEALDRADLILFLLDTSAGIDAEDREIAELIQRKTAGGTHCLCLLNKSDLSPKMTIADAKALFFPEVQSTIDGTPIKFLTISITSGEGLEQFRHQIQEMFHTGEIAAKNEIFLSSLREMREAESARDSLELVISSIDQGLSEDFFSIDLMNAYTSLGRILGEAVEDDLVEEIFTKFCLGK